MYHDDNNDSADHGNLIVPNDSCRIMDKNSGQWSSKMQVQEEKENSCVTTFTSLAKNPSLAARTLF